MVGFLFELISWLQKRFSPSVRPGYNTAQEAIAWSSATQIQPKAAGGGIFGRFSNFDKCRLEVAGDVISGRLMGPDVPENSVKFGDSSNNLSREILPDAV